MPDTVMTPVTLNKQVDDYGSQIQNDMKQGKYKIRLLPGPSFEDQKEENLESIQTVLQADPTLFKLVADLYVDNLPMANNIEMRNRLRTIVPPEIIEAGKTGKPIPPKPQQPPPELMMKMQELQMKHAQIMQQGQFKMEEIAHKEKVLQLEGVRTGADIHAQMQELENQRIEQAAKMKEQEMRYQAEIHRANIDAQIGHASNLVQLLTHNPHKKENV
jgi:hypothetical protein